MVFMTMCKILKFRLSWLNFYLEAQKNLQKSWLSNFPTRYFVKLQNLGSLNSWIRNFPTRFPLVAIFSNLLQFIQTSFYSTFIQRNMHQKTPKIDFFVIFRNLHKKLPICKKKYAKILKSVRAVVIDVENRQNGTSEVFLGSTFCVTDCT